jgi:hypothetical protein
MKLLFATVVLIVSQPCFAACTSQGEILPWGSHIRTVCFEGGIGKNVFPSPDKRKSVVAEMGIGFHVLENDRSLDLPAGANDTFYPSDIAWSPRSDRFFVNNGNGSGLDGWTLQIFRIEDSVVKAEPDFNGLVVAAFRRLLAVRPTRLFRMCEALVGRRMGLRCSPSPSRPLTTLVVFRVGSAVWF